MADKKTDDVVQTAASTKYVVEHAPKLPDANVSVVTPDPVIDQRLIELRNAEAKANADRVARK